jgi:hypothetical protein
MKINLDIVKDVTYKYAKLYYEILCIVGYTKIKNLRKFVDFKIYILKSRLLSFFFVAQNTMYLKMIFFMFVG